MTAKKMEKKRLTWKRSIDGCEDVGLCDGVTVGDAICKLADLEERNAVEVPDKKLLKAIKLLIKQYEHSKNSEYVHSPVAHALYHTWKQVDEGRG